LFSLTEKKLGGESIENLKTKQGGEVLKSMLDQVGNHYVVFDNLKRATDLELYNLRVKIDNVSDHFRRFVTNERLKKVAQKIKDRIQQAIEKENLDFQNAREKILNEIIKRDRNDKWLKEMAFHYGAGALLVGAGAGTCKGAIMALEGVSGASAAVVTDAGTAAVADVAGAGTDAVAQGTTSANVGAVPLEGALAEFVVGFGGVALVALAGACLLGAYFLHPHLNSK
jgi:hypothetical protein